MQIDEGIHPELAQDAGMDRLGAEMRALRLFRRVPPAAAVIDEMLMHQRDAHLLNRNGPVHRHHQA